MGLNLTAQEVSAEVLKFRVARLHPIAGGWASESLANPAALRIMSTTSWSVASFGKMIILPMGVHSWRAAILPSPGRGHRSCGGSGGTFLSQVQMATQRHPGDPAQVRPEYLFHLIRPGSVH